MPLKVIGRKLYNPEGQPVPLSNNEFNLLHALAQHLGTPLSRQALIEFSRVSGDEIFDRSIDVLIYRLRQKIETFPKAPEVLVTVRNQGYMLVSSESPQP